MDNTKKYVLDANIFIEAHQTYYAFDLAPSFWEKLIYSAEKEKLISIDKIREELKNGNKGDKLSDWISNHFHEWFESCADDKVYQCYGKIMDWAQNSDHFNDSAKEEFARSADAWVVAYAKAHNYTVVTHESYDQNIKKRIKIPNVCETFGIPYTNTFTMLRNLNIKIG